MTKSTSNATLHFCVLKAGYVFYLLQCVVRLACIRTENKSVNFDTDVREVPHDMLLFPFLSIALCSVQQLSPHEVCLLYSNYIFIKVSALEAKV